MCQELRKDGISRVSRHPWALGGRVGWRLGQQFSPGVGETVGRVKELWRAAGFLRTVGWGRVERTQVST